MHFSKLRDMPPATIMVKPHALRRTLIFFNWANFLAEPSVALEVTKEMMITWNFGGRQQVLKGTQSFVLDTQKEDEGNNTEATHKSDFFSLENLTFVATIKNELQTVKKWEEWPTDSHFLKRPKKYPGKGGSKRFFFLKKQGKFWVVLRFMKLEGEKLNNTSPMRLNLLKRELGDRMKIEGFL